MAETETCGPKIAKRSSSPPVYLPGQVWEKGGCSREVIQVHNDGRVTYKSTNRRVTVSAESWRRWIDTGYLYEPGTKAMLKNPPPSAADRQAARNALGGSDGNPFRWGPQSEWDGPLDCDDID